MMVLEPLHGPLVFFGLMARGKRPQIPAPAGSRVGFSRIESETAGR
jgi:hypothetical protein